MKHKKLQRHMALFLAIVMWLSLFSPFGSVFAEEFGTDQVTDTVETDSESETSETNSSENPSWIIHFNPGDFSDYDENSNGKMEDQIIENNNEEELIVKLTKNVFNRDGYSFSGWSNTPNGKDIEDDPETEDIDESVQAFTVLLEDEQNLSNWSFTRDTDSDGTDESFDVSYAFNEGVELTLYAQWKKDESSSSLGQSIQNILGSIFNTSSEDKQTDDETSTTESEESSNSNGTSESTTETPVTTTETETTQPDESEYVADGIQAEELNTEVETDENGVVIEESKGFFTSIASSVQSFFSALSDEDSKLVSYSDEDDNYTADGTTIEKLKSFWITNNAGYDPLEITTSSTAKLSMTYRVEYAISGQYDFAAGEVELRVPAVVFKDRSGKDEGTLALAVPEDPDKGAEFNYRRVGDEYILTNTRRMSGASSGYFEFTFKDLDPVELVSGQEWGPFNVQLSVITNSGDTLTKTSNSLTAIVNTNETISSAYKRGDLYDSFPSSWSKAVTLPDGFNKDDYIYVDWYTYCYITGNQYFTMGISDDISNSGVDGAVLLGGTLTDQAGNSVYAKDNLFTGWKGSGNNFYHHLYVAYPKSKFPATVTNTVNYTLTTLDTEISTTKSATASLFYEPKPFSVPRGRFQAHKWGVSKNGQFKSNTSYYDQSNNLGIGNYPYALNELSQGSSTKLTYETVSEGFPFPCTYEGDGSEDSLNDISNYGKKSVHFSQEDSRLWFDFDYDNQLTGADYRVTGVEFLTPVMYTYSKDNAGNWGYYTSSSVEAPEIHIYGKSDTGNWIEYGTVTWSTDSSRTITITPMNGASVSEKHLLFPEGVTSWKSEFDTAAAGVKICICPTVELFSTENFRNVVAELMANSDSAYTEVRNSMSMTVTQDDATLFYADDRSGYDKLTAATQAFWMRKNGSVIKNDTTNKVASLKYEATVFEQSSLTEKSDYQAAVESGVINQDHGGTFYDLLPAQVAPDLSTVTVSGGNVTNVQLHENWRGSGRSLLEVSFTRDPKTTYIYSSSGGRGNSYGDYFTLSFNAAYTWIDMFDRGCTVTNVIAYGSDEEWLGNIAGLTGSPDDPMKGDNAYTTQAVKDAAQYLTDLKAEHDNPSFVYSSNVLPVNVETAALNSLQKYVSVLNNGIYVTGSASELSVPEGGAYTYMLRMTNDSATKSKNLILYDDLEAFVPGTEYANDHGKSQWQGYFRGLDLSQIEAMGVAPVVYYATQSVGLDNYKDDGSTVDLPNLSDTTVWSPTCPSDPSLVKAIAIDCSKDKDGNEFVLQENQSIQALVLMRAPTGDIATQAINDNAYAFNNVYVNSVKTIDGQDATSYIHHDYTRLLLAPYNITVNKIWNDDSNRDGIRPGSVTVQLTRTGSDGVTENVGDPVELNEGNKWSYQFEHLVWGDPNGIAYQYSVTELNTPEGYTPSVFFDGFEEIRLTNTHKIAVLPYQNAQKTWEDEGNEDQRPSSITLTLYKNGSSYKRVSLSPSADGTWIWNFDELPKFEDGQEINWTISENYVPGYVFESERTETSWNLNNRYDPYGDITLTKTLVDATSVSEQNLFTFTFTLMDKNGEYDGNTYEWESNKGNTGTITNGDSITISRDETITIKKIPSESTYEFVEERVNGFTLSSSKNLKGTVKAGQSSEVTCTNTYNATGTVQIVANKVLEGRTLKNAQFRFNLMNSDGTIIRSATNDADGKVAFGAITYGLDDVGQTYQYTITEVDAEKPGYTYDDKEIGVSVTVTDNGDGTLNTNVVFDNQINTFTNEYHAEGSFNLTAHKYVTGCEAYGGMSAFTGVFGFELLDETGNPLQIEALNDSDGEVFFPTITFDENDVGEKTFKIREITPGRNSERFGSSDSETEYLEGFRSYNTNDGFTDYSETAINYDAHTATITIKIVDNGDGSLTCVLKSMESDDERDNSESLVFKNKLKDGDLIITKEVNDSSVEDFEFEVTLTPPDGVEIKDGVYDYDVYEGVISLPRIGAENSCSETGVIIHNPESDKTVLGKIIDSVVDFVTPTTAYAADIPGHDPTVTDSTDIGNGSWDTCKWRITSDGVLTIGSGEGSNITSYYDVPWYSNRTNIKQVRTESGVILPSNSSYLFMNCSNATDMDLSGFDTSKVTNMSGMFSGCSGLTELNVSNFNTGKVTDMSSMFKYCSGLTSLNLSPLDTGNVTNMSSMFYDCSGLTSLNLSSLDTGNVTNMSSMFYRCSGLTSLDLSSLDTGNVTNMSTMFYGCSKLTSLDVSNFDTVKVAYMDSMFTNCSKLTKIKIGSNYYNSSINYTVNQYLPGLMGWKWTSEDGNFDPYTPSDLQKEFSSSAERAAELSGWWEVDIPDYKITIKDGKFTVKVPAHSHVIISGIPAGTTYTVEELDKDGWTLVEHQSSGSNIIRPSTNSGENISEWDSSLSIEYFYNISNTTKYTSIPVSAEKLLNGDLPTTSFEFNLSDVTDSENPKSLGSVHSSGVYAYHPGMIDLDGFSSSSFETGSYRLQLTEVIPEDNDTYIYDDHAYFITFDVIEEDGTKYFTNIGTEGSMTFRNYTKDYNSDNDNSDSTFSIELVKKVTDASGTDISDSKANQPFTFDLTLTDKTGTPLNGLYGGRLNVVDGKASVQVYPGEGNKVTLTDIPEGTIYSVSEVDIPDGYSWDGSVNIEKIVEEPIITEDTNKNLYVNGIEFEFWVYKCYSKYGDIVYDKLDYFFEETLIQLYPNMSVEDLTDEQLSSIGKTIILKMWNLYEDSGNISCTITNVYDPVGYAQIDAAKKFNGNLSTGIFTFGLYDSDGNLVSTAANNSDGSIYFDELTYKQAGTYNYTIREIEGTDSMITYDTTAIPVSVVVTDNGDGTLNTDVRSDQKRVFTNTVKTGSLTVTKAVRNGTENALKNAFTFTLSLKDPNGNDLTNKYPYSVGEKSGTIGSGDTFQIKDSETFEVTDLPAGTVYEITESDSEGFTLVEESSMSGQIEADQVSAVRVTNLYDANNDPDKVLNLGEVIKLLIGGNIENYTFNFEVRDENGSVVSTGQSDSEGSVTFSPVSYTLEDVGKTYQYTVAEVNDGQSGIKYDSDVRTVNITVSDDGHGLIYSSAKWDDNPVFTNSVSYGDLPSAGNTSWFNIVLSLMLIGFLVEVAYALSKKKMK